VESCTAVAERHDGQFEIITWTRAVKETEPVEATTQQQRAA
jgi:hypothetical protein